MKETNFTNRWTSAISASVLFALLFILPLFTSYNLNAQCTPACNSGTNISVEGYAQGCVANVTLEMVGTLSPGCGESYRMVLRTGIGGILLETIDNANLVVDGVGPNSLQYNYIGETLVIELHDLGSGNFCWGWYTFEDKLPPIITCSADTIDCYEDVTFANISIDDCTPPVTPHIISMTSEEISCTGDNTLLRRFFRTYYATDGAGNQSATCTDTIYVRRPDLDSINWPANDTVYCDDPLADVTPEGYPAPSITGVPTIGAANIPLYPNNLMNVCNLFTTFTDTYIDLGCMKKIMRQWTTIEWYCGVDYDTSYLQVIFILDEEPPILTVPADFTVNTNPTECEATFTVPPASATDNCSDNLNWYVQYPGGFRNQNGNFNITLPVGVHTIYYTVNDGCINDVTDSLQVTVEDNQHPFPICIEFTVASIPAGSDYVRVFAASFDDGSWDNCGPVTLQVARMVADCNGDLNPQTAWADYIDFYCCDVSPTNYIQVRLQVTDLSGNTSECMISAKIQDKVRPTIICPPTVTITCGDYYDLNDLDLYFGEVVLDPADRRVDAQGNYIDGYATDNCDLTVTSSSQPYLDNCGSGYIVRTFTATDQFGNVSSCTQYVYITKDPLDLHPEYFNPPNDTIIVNGSCNVEDLEPDDLPNSMRPVFLNDQVTTCFELAYNYTDEVYVAVDGACFKIIRTWKIIDWCWAAQYGIEDALAHAVTFTHYIKVMNTIAPIFNPIADVYAESNDGTCEEEFVDLVATATDDCTPDNLIKYRYTVDENYSQSGLPTINRQGNGNNASGVFPLGLHRVCFYATDLCGNVTEECIDVEVVNVKKPTPVAHHLVTEIMPSTGTITLPAWYFDAGSFAACGGPLHFSFSQDITDTLHTFDCDDVGNNPPASINFYVTDQYGNWDFVVVTVIIQDNNNVCDGTTTSLIAGNILTDKSEGVPKIDVTAGSTMNTKTTNEGTFKFNAITFGNEYTVRPSSSSDPVNGVETSDIIKVQNHILGKKTIDVAYKMIAADVTVDNKVNVNDILAMRSLLLGKTEQFPSGMSWRFVDSKFVFTDAETALESNFPEAITVVPTVSMNDINFVGVKLGDLNNNVKLNLTGDDIEVRSSKTLTFKSDDQELTAGIPTEITLTAEDFNAIEGFQFALRTSEGVTLQNIYSTDLKFDESNFNQVSDHTTRISWNTENGVNQLGTLTLVLVSDRNINLSEALSVSQDDLKPAGFGFNEDKFNIAIDFNTAAVGKVLVHQNRPNPYTDETFIGVDLPEELDVTIKIFDISGRLVSQQTNKYGKGYNEVRINTSDFEATGVLYYEVSTKLGAEMKKMIRIKN